MAIKAPRIARQQKPGQFVIPRIHEEGDRIPVTIENSDTEKGVDQHRRAVRRERRPICSIRSKLGDSILDVVGSLGKPSEIRNDGTVVMVGGGVALC